MKNKSLKTDGRAANGGARPGAGAPKKEPTKTLAFRVPLIHAAKLKKLLDNSIAGYLKKATKSKI